MKMTGLWAKNVYQANIRHKHYSLCEPRGKGSNTNMSPLESSTGITKTKPLSHIFGAGYLILFFNLALLKTISSVELTISHPS